MPISKENIDEAILMIRNQTSAILAKELEKISPEFATNPELKEAVLSSLDISYEQQRIQSAFDSIADYLDHFSYPVEIQEINDNWVQAFQQFTAMLEGKKEVAEEGIDEPLQTLIGLSPKTYELFYTVGKQLYEQNSFEKAGDVFFLLALFNHCYPNVWVSFGLSEQKCGRFELALRAFAMGAITNIDSPEPYLCSADCCIAMNNLPEAKIYLEEAMERLNKDSQYEPFKAEAERIETLLAK